MSVAFGTHGGGGGNGGEDPDKPVDLPSSHGIGDFVWDPEEGILKIKGLTQSQRGAVVMRFIKRFGLNPDGTINADFLKMLSHTDCWNYINSEGGKRRQQAADNREVMRRGDLIRDFLAEFPAAARALRTVVRPGAGGGLAAVARRELHAVRALEAVNAVPPVALPAPAVPPAAAAAGGGEESEEEDDDEN